MPTEKKVNQVSVLEEKLKGCTIAISTEFRGLSVEDMAELRRKLREAGVEYLVVKKTLAGIAGDNLGKPLRDILVGSIGIAFGYGAVTEPAKALADHIQATKVGVTIHGALMDGDVLTGPDVQRLATIPGRPVLMSQMMGNMLAPLTGLVYAMMYHVGGLARVLDARRQQLDEEAGGPAAEAAATTEAAPESSQESEAEEPAEAPVESVGDDAEAAPEEQSESVEDPAGESPEEGEEPAAEAEGDAPDEDSEKQA